MSDDEAYHACIMAECGCHLEDICITLALDPAAAYRAVSPVLHLCPHLRDEARAWVDQRRRQAA